MTQFQFPVCMYCTCGRIDNKARLDLMFRQMEKEKQEQEMKILMERVEQLNQEREELIKKLEEEKERMKMIIEEERHNHYKEIKK